MNIEHPKELIIRKHNDLLGKQSYAVYSPCEKYRYFLERTWNTQEYNPLIMIMLNPSTATEYQNDPTVERCERRARQNGYSGMIILNIFAYRATDPKEMRAQADPVGNYNDYYIEQTLKFAPDKGAIVCGWGTHGTLGNRSERIFELLQAAKVSPLAFKWTKGGEPGHPLYISYAEQPKSKERLAVRA